MNNLILAILFMFINYLLPRKYLISAQLLLGLIFTYLARLTLSEVRAALVFTIDAESMVVVVVVVVTLEEVFMIELSMIELELAIVVKFNKRNVISSKINHR